MTNKLILEDLSSLQNDTTVINIINDNNDALVEAFDNTLSLDGSAPNSMNANLDMNNFQIINLPNPASNLSPLRLQDLVTFNGGGTIGNIPPGGTIGQVLAKNSNVDFDDGWTNSVTSVGLTLPADFTVTGSPVTTTGTINANWTNGTTGSGSMVKASSPVLTGTPSAPQAPLNTSTTQLATTNFVTSQAATANPLMDGAVSVGNSLQYARQDHVHPSDNTKAPLASPALTGIPTAPTASPSTNTTQIATTAFVLANATSSGVASIDGTTGAITTGNGVTSSAGVIKLANSSATINVQPSNPAATTNTTGVMMGLGSTCTLTPIYSSRIKAEFIGRLSNNTGGAASTYSLRYGTGTAPTNGASAAGTVVMAVIPCTAVGGAWTVPFTASAIITGLTPGTAYWFDIYLTAGSNTATVSSITFNAMEF